jgi:F-type H+-transporting ATPase subunit gamma
MPSLKALKTRINSVKSTQKITKALKVVAAAKLRRAQDSAEAARPYADRMESVLASLGGKVTPGPLTSPLLAGTGRDQVHLLVVVTSERGLAGGFNSNITRLARRTIDALERDGKTVKLLLVGKKSRAALARTHRDAILHLHDLSGTRQPGLAEAQQIADDINARFAAGEFDVAHLIYSRFRSVLSQDPVINQLIPVKLPQATEGGVSAAVEYEPDEEAILNELLPRNITVQLLRAILENAAGFYGSQMTAMDNATRNAGERIKNLTLVYNRTRQAAITKELIEIISGAEAL